MSRLLVLRLLATLIGVGCYATLVLYPSNGVLPFDSQSAGTHHIVVKPTRRHAMPAGLHAGERIDLRDQSFAARTLLVMGHGPVGAHFTIVIPKPRETRIITTMIATQNESLGSRLAGILSLTLLLALCLVTLWWGRDWIAWGLSIFALATITGNFLTLSFSAATLLPLMVFNMLLVSPLVFFGLYLTVRALVRDSLGHRARLAFGVVLVFAIVGSSWLDAASIATAIGFGNLGLQTALMRIVSIALFLLSFMVPVAMILAGYRHATAERRLRIRWILWSLVLFAGAITWKTLGGPLSAVWIMALWWLALLVSLGALLYAVLHHRVVVLSFVINRAIAFSLSAGLIVGLFALLQTVIENTALSRQAGLFLTVIVSVALGVGFDVLRGRINRYIELIFFRAQYRAAAALERFAMQCHFIESENELLDQTVDETASNTGAQGVALYERSTGGYRLLRSRGDQTFPLTVKFDDRAFVALRAEPREQDLADLRSDLGANGYVFPMTVRGAVLGALVCGTRTEHYTPAERHLLARLTHEVGGALTALRARQNELIVDALVAGDTPLDALRTRALALFKSRAVE